MIISKIPQRILPSLNSAILKKKIHGTKIASDLCCN